MRANSRSRVVLLFLLALAVGWSASAQAGDPPTFRKRALRPLPGHTDSFALGLNDRGHAAGHSSSVDGHRMAVKWDSRGNPTALSPLDGDDESFAVAINKSGQVVGTSRNNNNGDTCPLDTAVIWSRNGTVQPLWPASGDRGSTAHGLNDQGLVAGTSHGFPFDDEVDCSNLFTPVVWDSNGTATVLPPLEGFNEGYSSSVTSSGDVIGGSVNVTTGFNFQATMWHAGDYAPVLLAGPDDAFVNTAGTGNAAGWAVGDSYDFTFASRAVVWDGDGVASLRRPLDDGTQSSGRAINMRGEVAGISWADGPPTAVVWTKKGKPIALRALPGDPATEALAVNRSGQVAGRSFGAGTSTAMLWSTQ